MGINKWREHWQQYCASIEVIAGDTWHRPSLFRVDYDMSLNKVPKTQAEYLREDYLEELKELKQRMKI
jgi:hypothetical protein